MGLLDEIREEPLGHKGLRCSVGALLLTLPKPDAEDLRTALGDPTIAHAAIRRVLVRRGHDIGPLPIARHRRGQCQCEEQGYG